MIKKKTQPIQPIQASEKNTFSLGVNGVTQDYQISTVCCCLDLGKKQKSPMCLPENW